MDVKTIRLRVRCNVVTKRFQEAEPKYRFVYEGHFQIVWGEENQRTLSGKVFEMPSHIRGSPFGELKIGFYEEGLFEPGRIYTLSVFSEEEVREKYEVEAAQIRV